MGVSKSNPDEMKNLIAKLMHELAIQIDLFYEDQEIGILANADSTFRVFRRGLQWMDDNRMPWSKTIRHVCNRIHGCHAEYFAEPMDDPDIAL